MTPSPTTITNEQVNSLPLLLGIIIDMGMRDLIDTHVTPHGNWGGASVGTVLSIWLSHLLHERDHTMVAVRDWAADRVQTLNTLLDCTLRDTDCTDDRLASILTMLGDPTTQATLDVALIQRWVRVYRLPTDKLPLAELSFPMDVWGVAPRRDCEVCGHRQERVSVKDAIFRCQSCDYSTPVAANAAQEVARRALWTLSRKKPPRPKKPKAGKTDAVNVLEA